MTAATTYTYDATPPRRPSLEDLGGDEYENDPADPPDRRTMPNAEEHNERARNQAGLNRVCPTAILYVTFSGGTPSISSVYSMSDNIDASDFTVTDNGTGDTSITTTALPTAIMPPGGLTITSDVDVCGRAPPITNGVRVKTVARNGGAATDANFRIDWY